MSSRPRRPSAEGLGGIQGEGGAGSRAGREDAGGAGDPVRCTPQPDDGVEGAAAGAGDSKEGVRARIVIKPIDASDAHGSFNNKNRPDL